VATRILAHLGLLAPEGRMGALVGSEVVYLAERGTTAATMTPYDVCALRLDGTVLAGTPPEDADRYPSALRAGGCGAVALTDGGLVTAPDVVGLVEKLSRMSWEAAQAQARGAGALVGVYPADAAG
jgi:hypothetical protein